MAESDMRSKVVKVLKEQHGIAVENPALPGTPDINYIDGFIECKWLRAWPVRDSTVVALDHYTPQQKLFIRKRHIKGGRVFLLLQCRREWLLFKYPMTKLVGAMTREELIAGAYKYWPNGLNEEEFINVCTEEA